MDGMENIFATVKRIRSLSFQESVLCFILGIIVGGVAGMMYLSSQFDYPEDSKFAPVVLQYIVNSNAVEVEYSTVGRRLVVTEQDGVEKEFRVDEGGYVMERLKNDVQIYGEWIVASSYGDNGLFWRGERE